MISDQEKRRFLLDLLAATEGSASNNYGRSILLAIADDYDGHESSIQSMRPWFEANIALGRTVDDLAKMAGVERHRIVFALKELNLTAPGAFQDDAG